MPLFPKNTYYVSKLRKDSLISCTNLYMVFTIKVSKKLDELEMVTNITPIVNYHTGANTQQYKALLKHNACTVQI